MDIKVIKGNLQKLVAINANEQLMTVDLALGLIGAYMLKMIAPDLREWPAMEDFLNYLRSRCFNRNRLPMITESSFSDCALFIKTFLSTQPFEDKRGTLMSLELKVITEVNDNGYLSFNDRTFGAYASQERIDDRPANNYIVVDNANNAIENNNVEGPEERNVNTETPNAETNTEDNTTDEHVVPTQERHILRVTNNTPREQNHSNDISPFTQLYDVLLSADPERRREAQYVWQWFLTLDEYNSIKECLSQYQLPTPGKWDNKTVRLLALYIGEFYKREYENNATPFSKLGETTPNYGFRNYNKICDRLNIEVYKKDNQAHLHTLFVNGGLPIHYISSRLDNDQSNLFIDGLSKLLEVEDEINLAEGEEALGRVNNTSLRESYQRKHSIFQYIQAIMNKQKTWNDSDNESQEYRNFTDKVKEANKKATERRKFKLFYSLWTYIHDSSLKEFSLKPQIRFNPEDEGERHYALSSQRIANWGITNPPAQFSLRFGDEEMNFTICCNGDYISWDMADRIDLPILSSNLTPNDLLHSDLKIVFDRLDGETSPIRNDINLPFKAGFLQFYTDDDPSMASWNSYKGSKSFLWSGLLFDKTRYHLLSQDSITDINDNLGWVSFSDYISFEDTRNGKIHTFYNSKGRIYAKPALQSLHKKIIDSPCLANNCLLNGIAECIIGEEHSHAFVVYSSNIKFDIFRVATDEKIDSNPVINYKSAKEYLDTSSSWIEYNSKELEQGLYIFRISVAHYYTDVKCYVLPDNAEIEFQSVSTPYLVKFKGFTNVSSLAGIPSTIKDDGINFRISNNNAGTFDFSLGNNFGSILLQTFHPRPQIHMFLYGKEINEGLIAFADDIEVKLISRISKSFHLSEDNRVSTQLFARLTANVGNMNNQALTDRINLSIDDTTVVVRVYTQNISSDNDTRAKFILLDLESNNLIEVNCNNPINDSQETVQTCKHDGLLFQSLKVVDNAGVYYAPKFIPKNGQRVANNVKTEERQKRLALYATDNTFISDYAYLQFEIACEHKLYFAVFDSLLSMCWNSKKNEFLKREGKQFKTNILCYLKGYAKFTAGNSLGPFVSGLKRLAREFLFDWKIIKTEVEREKSPQLQQLYQQIINQ